jgi:hypothetical protein
MLDRMVKECSTVTGQGRSKSGWDTNPQESMNFEGPICSYRLTRWINPPGMPVFDRMCPVIVRYRPTTAESLSLQTEGLNKPFKNKFSHHKLWHRIIIKASSDG